MPETKHTLWSTRYASIADFESIFQKNMDSLFLLSFLLTADLVKAEQCFIGGLDDAIAGNPVFKEWARSWAERMIIQNALRVVSPKRNQPGGVNRESLASGTPMSPSQQAIAGILGLQPFDRFVYVMSVLEHYSDQHCAVLLGCTVRDIVDARIRALQQVGDLMQANFGGTANPRPEKLSLRELGAAAVGWLVRRPLATTA